MKSMCKTAPIDDQGFVRPDYSGGGLVNLMATLAAAGGAAMPYPRLDAGYGLDAGALAATQRLVLIVIDGLGDDLVSAESAPNLAAHRVGRLSSVFPSTTASAVTTLLTGLAPAQHGLTGWHMWFAEIGETLAVLPLVPRGPRRAEWNRQSLPARLFAHQGLSERLRRRHVTLSPQTIVDSPFNVFHTGGSLRLGYRTADEFFPGLAAAIAADAPGPSFFHAYLPDLDELMHEFGPSDRRCRALLARIDAAFGEFLRGFAGRDTTFIVTADHGFIEAPEAHLIDLDQHPKLAAMLARPLCGERRVAFAYVRRRQRGAFEAYVGDHFAAACRLIRSDDFIAEGWFGPTAPPTPAHPRLLSRAGDYVLLMRDDWTIKDWLPGEKHYPQRGVHAGASAAEMSVPLIVART